MRQAPSSRLTWTGPRNVGLRQRTAADVRERQLLARSGHSPVSRLGPCTEDDSYGVKNLLAIGRCIAQNDFALASASALEQTHQCSLRDRVEVEIEPHYRSRRIRRNRKRLLRNRKYRKDVTVRMIVGRWARTAVTRLSEVRPCLKSSRRELASLRVARIQLQFGRSDRDVDDQPVPKAAAGRSVGVIAGYGEAFRSAWRARPRQMRRLITSRTTEAKIFREYMSFGKGSRRRERFGC